ncbi:hypothetical protein BCR43DRAFT_489482 [Syncephalastrum racemosum]|uniref:Uncharacterized protein n=1 Tax=Syncephalastrum racemosum TaxID=13706 RepID=A0A1X2HEB7_SYNRA|nr:hypothetical protein BCR43DRAFT_489482 [Syncephalastrum racemosum]
MSDINTYRKFSIQEGDIVLDTAMRCLSAACIAQWLQKSPTAKATLTMNDGDTIDVPVYALRRRNAVVANLPDAPAAITA